MIVLYSRPIRKKRAMDRIRERERERAVIAWVEGLYRVSSAECFQSKTEKKKKILFSKDNNKGIGLVLGVAMLTAMEMAHRPWRIISKLVKEERWRRSSC